MSLVHGTGVDGASATGVNPVMIAGKDAAGNLDTLKVESGVVSTSVASALPAGTALLGKVGIDQTTPGVTNAVTLSGSKTGYNARDTITFGAGAGAHNANEVMSTDTGEILEFETGLSAGGSGVILDSLVTLAQNAVFLNQAGYKLHLFRVAPTIIADDTAFSILVAELPNYVGSIDISNLTVYGASCAAQDLGHNRSFTLAPTDTKLYGQLVCKGTDTTVDTVVMTINLGISAL